MYSSFYYIYPYRSIRSNRNSGNDDGDMKHESNDVDFKYFRNDVLYTTKEWVCGDKERVPDYNDFDGNDMVDIPLMSQISRR